MAFEKVGISAVVEGFGPYMRDIGQMDKKTSGFGGKLRTVVNRGSMAAAAGFVALGAAAFKFAGDFKTAEQNIVKGTGATGEALDGLKKDFRKAFERVPDDAGEVSLAIADLNTRLGLTGQPLQDATVQFLNFARVTGTDVSTAIREATRLFGDWSVAAENQAATLDLVFAASQRTGVGVSQLMDTVVQFGAPLRQLGFSLEESVALVSKFEQEGVNLETVMAGLRQGLARIAKAGEAPAETFRRVTQSIKDAGSTADANALAIETFGARAGPDMAAAIREGRFELDEMLDMLNDSKGSIDKTAEASLTWQDRLKILRNRLLVDVNPALEAFTDALEDVTKFLEEQPTLMYGVAVALGALAAVLVTAKIAMLAFSAATVVAKIAIGAATVAQWLFNVAMLANPLVLIAVAVAVVVAALVVFFTQTEIGRKIIETAWEAIKGAVTAVLDFFSSRVGPFFTETLPGFFTGLYNKAKKIFNDVKNEIIGTFNTVTDEVGKVFTETIPDALVGAGEVLLQAGLGAGKSLANGVIAGMNLLISGVESAINAILGMLTGGKLGGLISKGLGKLGISIPTSISLPRISPLKLDTGGEILKTGLAVVHEGEMVMPAARVHDMIPAPRVMSRPAPVPAGLDRATLVGAFRDALQSMNLTVNIDGQPLARIVSWHQGRTGDRLSRGG